ncbi:MAG: sulfatase-like hydrolase/transferase [Acidobacteriota bacterium]
MSEHALQFIRANQDGPFFCYVAFTIPHTELLVPEDSLAEYRGQFEETPYSGDHYGAQETPHAAYAAMVSRMDRDVGRILDLLEELGPGRRSRRRSEVFPGQLAAARMEGSPLRRRHSRALYCPMAGED